MPLALSSQNFNLAHNSKTVQHFLKKLGTHVPRNNTHVYTKSHNSGFDNYSVMPFFRLRKKQTSVGILSAALLFQVIGMTQPGIQPWSPASKTVCVPWKQTLCNYYMCGKRLACASKQRIQMDIALQQLFEPSMTNWRTVQSQIC